MNLARYLSIVIYGITVQAAGGTTRKELRSVAELALKNWPTRQGGRFAKKGAS
jgi:hypothetical protein